MGVVFLYDYVGLVIDLIVAESSGVNCASLLLSINLCSFILISLTSILDSFSCQLFGILVILMMNCLLVITLTVHCTTSTYYDYTAHSYYGFVIHFYG